MSAPNFFSRGTGFLGRSLEEITRQCGPMLRVAMKPWKDPFPDVRKPLVLAQLRSPEDLQQFKTGCDADIGGYSSVNLSLDDEGRGRLHGTLDTTVPPKQEGREKLARSGYIGMRTKIQYSVLGRRTWDTSDYRFLKVRVRNHVHTRSCFFVNLSTDEWDPPKLWQHRLWLHPTYNWQDVIIPLQDFTLTVQGALAKYPQQPARDDISTVGLSILGPRGGPFDLSIDTFEAINILSESHYRAADDERLLLDREERHPQLAAHHGDIEVQPVQR